MLFSKNTVSVFMLRYWWRWYGIDPARNRILELKTSTFEELLCISKSRLNNSGLSFIESGEDCSSCSFVDVEDLERS